MVQNFWKYVKFTCYRMINKRSQKRSMKWEKFEIVWRYYVKKPRLTKDIWEWTPKVI